MILQPVALHKEFLSGRTWEKPIPKPLVVSVVLEMLSTGMMSIGNSAVMARDP
jgi:hypothetical protein